MALMGSVVSWDLRWDIESVHIPTHFCRLALIYRRHDENIFLYLKCQGKTMLEVQLHPPAH